MYVIWKTPRNKATLQAAPHFLTFMLKSLLRIFGADILGLVCAIDSMAPIEKSASCVLYVSRNHCKILLASVAKHSDFGGGASSRNYDMLYPSYGTHGLAVSPGLTMSIKKWLEINSFNHSLLAEEFPSVKFISNRIIFVVHLVVLNVFIAAVWQ